MKIDIIIPTFNRAQSLARSLDSIYKLNDLKAHEVQIYVIDNNSTDETKSVVLQQLLTSPVKVQYLIERKQGKLFALNKGLEKCRADIVAFTDDDIILEPQWLQRIVMHLEKSQVDGVTGKIIARYQGDLPSWYSPEISPVLGGFDLGSNLTTVCQLNSANLAIRREALLKLKEINYVPELISEDVVLCRKFMEQKLSILYDPQMIVEHHFQSANLTKDYCRRWFTKSGRMQAELRKYVKKHAPNGADTLLPQTVYPIWQARVHLLLNFFKEPKRFFYECALCRSSGEQYQAKHGKSKGRVVFVHYLPAPAGRIGEEKDAEWIKQITSRMSDYDVTVLGYNETLRPYDSQNYAFFSYHESSPMAKMIPVPPEAEKDSLFDQAFCSWVSGQLKKIKPDIIHLLNYAGHFKTIKKGAPQAGLIVHIWESLDPSSHKINSKDFLAYGDIWIGASQHVANSVRKIHPALNKKTRCVYHGINMIPLPEPEDLQKQREDARNRLNWSSEMILLYSGRIMEKAGVDKLLKVMCEILRSDIGYNLADIRLIIAQIDETTSNQQLSPYQQNLYRIASEISDQVKFTGYLPPEKLKDYYLAANLCIIPAETIEGLYKTIPEAIIAGAPIMAVTSVWYKETINDRETGILIQDNSEKALKEGLIAFIQNPQSYRDYALNAQADTSERFNWDVVFTGLRDIYDEILTRVPSNE
jgi:glycosyltransferase involved in cell wall biosynthesis